MQGVIDSHFHIWDPAVQPLSWLDGTDGSVTHKYDMTVLGETTKRTANAIRIMEYCSWAACT